MRRSRAFFWPGLALIVPAVAVFWASVAYAASSHRVPATMVSLGYFAMALYLAWLTLFILRDLFSGAKVTSDRLCGAVSVYLLLGVAWGFLYSALELHAPGSFVVGYGLEQTDSPGESSIHRTGVLFYFSFVTLTTLGYGDVSPAGSVARMLTMWEAIVGQVYLTILVARLVGLHVTSAFSNKVE